MTGYRQSQRPMCVQVRPGSLAESRYYLRAALPGGTLRRPRAIVAGIDPAPVEDLIYFGGKVVPQMEFQNIYLGGAASWSDEDVDSIDNAILRAMRRKELNNVVAQYFPGATLGCDMRESFVVDEAKPRRLDERDVQAQVIAMYDSGLLKKSSLGSCLFNLILPSGTVLRFDTSSSLQGLGGYHGSVHFQRAGKRITLYYSANVYSQRLADGRENGIAVFDKPWKNVVGTLYHELNEFRTDADVNDANAKNNDNLLGWVSRSGQEIGDQPIFAAGDAGDLRLVFKEVQDRPRKVRLPVQFMYSNVAHGAEGPIDRPHA
jgi:hypothetical protein